MIVIIGNSAAAINAVEGIRSVNKKAPVTLLCSEKGPAYSRVQLPDYIAGRASRADLEIRNRNFYTSNNIKTLFGHEAVDIRPGKKKVVLNTGEELRYEKLFISTGASPFFPAIRGKGKSGVLGLRSIEDAEAIRHWMKRSGLASAVVVGGGLVGLKTAWALKENHISVSVVESEGWLLPRVLDREGAELLETHLKNNGYNILTSCTVEEITGGETVRGVKLKDGRVLDADLVIFSTGVKPNVHLVKDAGLEIDAGILVDKHMMTNIPDIFAGGDVAQGPELFSQKRSVNAIWPVAAEQGKVAGLNMGGSKRRYRGSLSMNIVELEGLGMASAGNIFSPSACHEVLRTHDTYKKLIIEGEHVVGAVMVGEVEGAGLFTSLIQNRCLYKRFANAREILEDPFKALTSRRFMPGHFRRMAAE